MDTILQPQIGVVTIVFKDGKILFGKRLKPIGHKMWSLPGGHLEMYESFEECSRRETREEAGIEIKNIRFLTARNNAYPEHNKHYITIIMLATHESGTAHVPENEREKCEEWQWFKMEELPEPLFEVSVIFSDFSMIKEIWRYKIANNGLFAKTDTVKKPMTVKEAMAEFRSSSSFLNVLGCREYNDE